MFADLILWLLLRLFPGSPTASVEAVLPLKFEHWLKLSSFKLLLLSAHLEALLIHRFGVGRFFKFLPSTKLLKTGYQSPHTAFWLFGTYISKVFHWPYAFSPSSSSPQIYELFVMGYTRFVGAGAGYLAFGSDFSLEFSTFVLSGFIELGKKIEIKSTKYPWAYKQSEAVKPYKDELY